MCRFFHSHVGHQLFIECLFEKLLGHIRHGADEFRGQFSDLDGQVVNGVTYFPESIVYQPDITVTP